MRPTAEIPKVSRPLLALFSKYAAGYLRRHFHSIRLLRGHSPLTDAAGPLVIFLNHASWWDPLVCLFLKHKFFPERSAYGPMDAAALDRYRFFARLGFFPVQSGTTRGAAQFLRTASAILQQQDSVLFLTPQGEFADVRAPLIFASGLEHLPSRAPEALFLPMALEYTFWEERKPEILLACGAPVRSDACGSLADRLGGLQAELAAAAQRRLPNEWHLLQKSRSGVQRPYDFWRGLRARLRGEAFRADHGQL